MSLRSPANADSELELFDALVEFAPEEWERGRISEAFGVLACAAVSGSCSINGHYSLGEPRRDIPPDTLWHFTIGNILGTLIGCDGTQVFCVRVQDRRGAQLKSLAACPSPGVEHCRSPQHSDAKKAPSLVRYRNFAKIRFEDGRDRAGWSTVFQEVCLKIISSKDDRPSRRRAFQTIINGSFERKYQRGETSAARDSRPDPSGLKQQIESHFPWLLALFEGRTISEPIDRCKGELRVPYVILEGLMLWCLENDEIIPRDAPDRLIEHVLRCVSEAGEGVAGAPDFGNQASCVKFLSHYLPIVWEQYRPVYEEKQEKAASSAFLIIGQGGTR